MQRELKAGLRDPVTVVGLAGAALAGLGIVFWVAANWDDFGRVGRFAILQGFVVAMTLGAWTGPSARAPFALGALLGVGALLAYFGQTYQTGADPWSLFGLWAALAAPLVLAARHDAVWLPWTLVGLTGISLWTHAHTGHAWRVEPDDLAVHAIAFAAAALLAALVRLPMARRRGAGPATRATAVIGAVAFVVLAAAAALFHVPVAPHYAIGLAVLAAGTVALGWRRPVDLVGLSAVVLGLDTLIVIGLARLLFELRAGDPMLVLFALGTAAAGLLAVSVAAVMKRARDPGAEAPAAAPPADLPARDPLAPALAEAAATGPAGPHPAHRPWPVVLLIGLGAWLSAVPLLGSVGLLLADVVRHDVGAYVVGALALAAGVAILRAQTSLFVEQLAVPVLLTGGATLAFGLFRDLPHRGAAAVMLLLCLALAAVLERRGLGALLGAAAAAFAAVVLEPRLDGAVWPMWVSLHIVLGIGLAALVATASPVRAGARAAAGGWVALTLAALALLSGPSIGAAGLAGAPFAGGVAGPGPAAYAMVMRIGSFVLGSLAAAGLARAGGPWGATAPAPLRWGCAGVAAALSAAMPMLGGALLAAWAAGRAGHRPLGLAAAIAAAWIVGSFYYALDWPLAHKAVALTVAGAALAALAWQAARGRGRPGAARTAPPPRADAVLSLVTAVVTLVVVNVAIRDHEQRIATGQPVFVELAPVDPRSLMQGDYMRLNFRLPPDVVGDLPSGLRASRPRAVFRRDARGVARAERVDDGRALAGDEVGIELTPKNGRWIVVSDAWHFREGDGARWAAARYGEFRVDGNGRALLVGLADAELRPIATP